MHRALFWLDHLPRLIPSLHLTGEVSTPRAVVAWAGTQSLYLELPFLSSTVSGILSEQPLDSTLTEVRSSASCGVLILKCET